MFVNKNYELFFSAEMGEQITWHLWKTVRNKYIIVFRVNRLNFI